MSGKKRAAVQRTREDRLTDEIERDLVDEGAWEQLPQPSTTQLGSLSTQVSVRLDADDAKRLRHVARAQHVGYTSLLRQWIRERLHLEDALLSSFSYEARGFTVMSGTHVQVSSQVLHIRDLVSP